MSIDDRIARPERAAVVFFIDGFGQVQFDQALAEDRIPSIARHLLRRGVRVEAAVACIPSITYANAVTFLTGRYPGRHGIMANKWFEPSTGRYQNYCFIKTYLQVDGDYPDVPTIYDILHDRVTVSIQAAMRRGCTHTIDNWATSGINWFFNNTTGVDCLVAQRFELIAAHTRDWGRWPDLIWVYFPGADNLGHRFGPDSPQYKGAVANVDLQIGRICEALQQVGMYERTYLCLVSDHGMIRVAQDHVLDIAALLRGRAGAKVWANRPTEGRRKGPLPGDYDFAVATSASRWAAVYPLPGGRVEIRDEIAALSETLAKYEVSTTGPDRISRAAAATAEATAGDPAPGTAEVAADVRARQERLDTSRLAAPQAHPSRRGAARDALPAWLRQAIDHPAVELAACCFRPGRVHLFSRDTYAVVIRTMDPHERHTVRTVTGRRVFAPHELPEALSDLEASDSRVWLRTTARDRYPDLVPQIAALFDSERAGTIVFFAADGWDFSADDPTGGHGSILAEEMLVPMLFAGPGLPAGGTLPCARTCDLMPTLLGLLRAAPVLENGTYVDTDGIDLLRSSRPTVLSPDARPD